MTAKAHAILSASSSDRWLHCPPSARLCEAYEDKGSDYAAEGTDAHALGEYKLKSALGLPSEDPTGSLTWYSEEMDDCTSGYTEYVLEQVEAAKETCTDPVVLIEQRVDFSRWVEHPPYGVSFKASDGLTIQNDSLKGKEFYNFLLAAFKNMADHLEKGGAAYCFHADTEGLTFRKAFIDAGFHLAGVCIWVKNSLVLGRSDYQWQHEPVLYGFLQNGKHPWYSDRKQTTIWNYDKPKRNKDHPTSKPLDLLCYPIQNSTQENSVVIDTFGGSGSTLMACEQLNRICYMMELDPKYASVILRRYVEDTGDTENVYVIRNGEKILYSALAKEVETSPTASV